MNMPKCMEGQFVNILTRLGFGIFCSKASGMTEAIIQGTYADFKLVRTRSVVQVIVEVPIERAGEVVERLGIPQPGNEQWVSVGLLQEPDGASKDAAPGTKSTADKPKRDWDDIPPSQQAGILCADLHFQIWIAARYNSECKLDPHAVVCTDDFAKKAIYYLFRIKSRSELNDREYEWNDFVIQYRADVRETAEIRG